MNEKYTEKINQLKATNEYQLELEAKNYKAALKQRVVIALNSGDTVFSLPLFLTDYYTLDDKRVWSKDRVEQKITELATLPDGRTLPPREFHVNLIEDYQAEWQRSQELLLENYRTTSEPKREDFDDGNTYAVAMERFVAREGALRIRERDDRNKMLDLLRFFVPGKPVQHEGNDGMFIGYRIKDTGTRFKYSLGSVEFMFCFLSKYPTLTFKASSDFETLANIKNVTQYFSNGDRLNRIVQEWKPDYNKRTIKRFLSGNILSGIIEANKKKIAGDITGWSLTRFTNIDGTLNTAVQLKYEKDLPATTIINSRSQDLSVTSDNIQFIDYVKMIPETFSYSGSEVYPIWNIENDKSIDRSVVILRRRSGYRNQVDPSVSNVINVEILQQYIKDAKTGLNKEIVIPPTGVVPKRYNHIYHDNLLLDRYSEYRIENGVKQSIKYGVKKSYDKKSGGGFKQTTAFNVMTVNVKSFNFDVATESGYQALKNFFTELHTKYDMAFNFRSSNSDYFNIENQADIFDPSKKVENKKAFEEGVYQYRFIRKVSDAIIDSIPNVINRTYEGANGGIELNYPLTPTLLPSYEMKPYRFPNEVMIKLVFSVLSDDKKLEFAKQLEDKAETEDAYAIGQYVSSFLADKTVNIIYFVGDLRTSEYGLIFKEYALKNDVKQIFFEEKEEKVQRDAKTKVTFEDAEKFLFALI